MHRGSLGSKFYVGDGIAELSFSIHTGIHAAKSKITHAPMKTISRKLANFFVSHENGIWRFNFLTLLILSIPLIWLSIHWDNYPLDFVNFTQGVYSKDFWQNCLVNFHTSLVDFLLLTLVAERAIQKIRQSRLKQEEKLELERKAQNEIRIIEEHQMLAGLTAQSKVPNYEAFFALLRLSTMAISEVKPDSFDLSNLIFEGFQTRRPHDFHQFNFSQSGLKNCQLKGWTFNNCRLKHFDFSGGKSNLENFSFNHSEMLKADFKDSKLQRAKFERCTLQGANFLNSDIRYGEFLNCEFNSAIFDKTKMNNCTFWGTCPTRAQLQLAQDVFPITIGGTLCQDWEEFENAYGSGKIPQKSHPN
ncbi:pentapeptide repeat-containing protein [Paraburkholderia sediminicola]|uniref:pentapeptide repeat-containing protein n=1 Tax=Paraburkholderia sediminicola TaxID=458836 RepID=UPI0038B6B29E